MNINFNGVGTSMLSNRRSKFGVGSLVMSIVFGLLFAGAGYFVINSGKIDPNWVREDGKVTSVNMSSSSSSGIQYSPTVSYVVNGTTYKVSSSFSSSAYPTIGSAKQIAYNPADPTQAKVVETGPTILFALLFGVIGIIILIGAPVLFVRSLKRGKNISSLKQTGQKVRGVITNILTQGGQGNASTKVVVTATNLSGTVENFISGFGTLAMTDFSSNPIPVDVYINPTNPKDYYVDIAELPNLTS